MLGCHTELYNEGGIDEQPEVAPRVTSTRREEVIPSAPISVAKGNFVALRITTFGGYLRRRKLNIIYTGLKNFIVSSFKEV